MSADAERAPDVVELEMAEQEQNREALRVAQVEAFTERHLDGLAVPNEGFVLKERETPGPGNLQGQGDNQK